MKKTFYIIYTIFIGLIFLIALSVSGIKIYDEYSHGDLRSQIRFDKICSNIKQISAKTSTISSGVLKQIENAAGDTNDFSSLEIIINGKKCYSYSKYNQTDSESKLIKNYSKSFTTGDNTVFITSSMYLLRPAVIYTYIKTDFIIILVFTIITIIFIIYIEVFGKNSSNDYDSVSNNNTNDDNENLIDGFKIKTYPVKFDEPVNKNTENTENLIINSASSSEINIDTTETSSEIENISKNTLLNENKTAAAETLSAETEKAPVIVENNSVETVKEDEVHIQSIELPSNEAQPVELESDNPSGLFSPETGLGWESYITTRLDNELNRATASEIDLALFVIKIPQLSRTNSVAKEICEYLTVEFQFKDMLFEYKEDSIVGIKISMDIEDALEFADKLYLDINKMLENEKSKCFIGISTRTVRMITGERLLKEADEAVNHAVKENEGIIAFRADALKYRQYLENQN